MKKEKLSRGSELLIEDLANLEHIQWIEWSKNLAKREHLSEMRLARWKRLWIPYKDLSEEEKEQDRIWARKVLQTMWNSASKELKLRNKDKKEKEKK